MLRSIFLPASALRSVLAQPGFLHQVRDSAEHPIAPQIINSFNSPKSTMPLERSTDPLVWIDCEVRPDTPSLIQTPMRFAIPHH